MAQDISFLQQFIALPKKGGLIDTEQRTSVRNGILFLIAIGIAIILVYLFYPKEKMQETISDPLPIIFETLWHWIT